jgi:hypothetical protein
MEGFSFVTPVTGLNRPNTGKEDDYDECMQITDTIYIYIYMCVCVCVCVCARARVCVMKCKQPYMTPCEIIKIESVNVGINTT